MVKRRVIELPHFFVYLLPSGALRRQDSVREFLPLEGPVEKLEHLQKRDLQGVIFKLPDGRVALYPREVLEFESDLAFACPFCRRKIQFNALVDHLFSKGGVHQAIKLLGRVFEEVERYGG